MTGLSLLPGSGFDLETIQWIIFSEIDPDLPSLRGDPDFSFVMQPLLPLPHTGVQPFIILRTCRNQDFNSAAAFFKSTAASGPVLNNRSSMLRPGIKPHFS